jgi:hypothetical protein
MELESEVSVRELMSKLQHIEELLASISSTFNKIEIENKENIVESFNCIKSGVMALLKCVGK